MPDFVLKKLRAWLEFPSTGMVGWWRRNEDCELCWRGKGHWLERSPLKDSTMVCHSVPGLISSCAVMLSAVSCSSCGVSQPFFLLTVGIH